MSDVRRRVTKLEAATVPAAEIHGPVVYRAGETPEAALERLGLRLEDIEARPVIFLPEVEGLSDER